MIAFALLLDRLAFAPGPAAKATLLQHTLATTPDPDRGVALALLTGARALAVAKPSLLRGLAARLDPVLFALSHAFVGDLAETVALMWPEPTAPVPPGLAELAETLDTTAPADLPALVTAWLDRSPAGVRVALLKLLTAGPRITVPLRLACDALARLSGHTIPAEAIEEVWHGLTPPYTALFAWLEGHGPRPDPKAAPLFRPLLPAHPLADAPPGRDPATLRAEWKWDGLRVQLAATPDGRRLFSRDAEDLSAAFPDLLATLDLHGVLDGELIALRDAAPAPFAALRPRLTRRAPTARLQRDHPVEIRLFDMLFDGPEDLRPLPFDTRRARLEHWFAQAPRPGLALSPLLPFTTRDDLAALHASSTGGLILKRPDAPYRAQPPGPWWAWPPAPHRLDAVLMYLGRGPGPAHPECTFGVWRDDGVLVPVGKAATGLNPFDLALLDQWVRAHTTQRFGPVREVAPGLVLGVTFAAAEPSARHKAGVTLRNPRLTAIRPDRQAASAGRLAPLLALAGVRPDRDA